MLATNPSPGLSQFSVNLLSEPVDLRNCSPPNGINTRSFSPKSTDENVSGSSATTTSSPSTTPALLNNNNNNNNDGIDGNNTNDTAKSGPGSNDSSKNDNIFENISLLAQGNLWGNALGNNDHQHQQQHQQALMDAALFAMTTQPMNASLRDPEVLQQFLKQHALQFLH
uniref:Uncharacterized protein n=1 Tax=Panagrolaimus superbus TaxID=310955 RepID=A0A914ZB79_9BILA